MKTILIIIICSGFVFVSCSKQNYIEIGIPLAKKDAIDYKSYDKIFVGDFKIESSEKSFNPESELYQFFRKDFSLIVNKKIEKLNPQNSEGESFQNLKDRLRNFPDSLFITGELKIDIKTRSIIKNVKNMSKTNNKAFVKVHLWDMILTIIMFDSNTGKIVNQNIFKEKLKDADPSKMDYNFKLMFDAITDRFIRTSTRKIRIQKRYLLLK